MAPFSLGSGPDVLAYDPGLHLLYVASEAGIVSLFRVASATITQAGEGFIGPNAHVVAVDPASHRAYFPLMDVGCRAQLRSFLAKL